MTEKGTASGREQMLDAAESCLQRFGLAKTTIEGRDDDE
jgi:AcrR family transcriptional regulator